MPPFPTPVRAALGLLANAVDAARTLPDRAVELPVLAVSTALQFSLRAQQRYAELALRGDELIGRLHGPPEEPPDWATFDDSPDSSDSPVEPNGSGAPGAPSQASSTEPGQNEPTEQAGPGQAGPGQAGPGQNEPTALPEDIPIGATEASAAPVKSAAKQPRARKAAPGTAKKTTSATSKNAKTVRAPRRSEPSAFDRTDDH